MATLSIGCFFSKQNNFKKISTRLLQLLKSDLQYLLLGGKKPMIKPLKNYVVLKKEKVEEKKVGSIILSSTKKDDANVANIIEVGEEVKNSELVKGAKVVYKEYSTTSYKENDDEYLLIKDEDILAVIK